MADGWLLTCPGHFTARNDQVPIVEEAGWAPGPFWTVAKNLAPHQSSIPGPYSPYSVNIPAELFYPLTTTEVTKIQFASNCARTHFGISLSKSHCFQTSLCFSYTCYIAVSFISVFNISTWDITSLSTGKFGGSIANFPPPDRLVILRHFLHSRENHCTAVTQSAHYTWQDYKTNKDILTELKINPVVVKTQNYRRK